MKSIEREQGDGGVVGPLESASEARIVKLQGALDISSVEEMSVELLSALESAHVIELDLQEVGRVDTLGLQLLYAFGVAADRAGVGLRYTMASSTLCEAASSIGMAELLGFAPAAESSLGDNERQMNG